jgi:hypothetical protein
VALRSWLSITNLIVPETSLVVRLVG